MTSSVWFRHSRSSWITGSSCRGGTVSAEATAAVDEQTSTGDQRLAVLLAMAMFVLVVDTSLMNVSISAVVHDLPHRLQALGGQVGLSGPRCRPVGAKLGEELVGVAALVEHPPGVQLGVAVRAGLAAPHTPLRRL